MPRGQLIRKKRIILDPKYKNPVIGKFVTRMMEQGKKSVSYGSIYDALDIIAQKVSGKEPVEVFQKALDNVKPVVEVKSRRVGGATLQVPVEIREERRDALAMRWIIGFSRSRHGRSMAREARGRADRRVQQYGVCDQEEGRHPQDGGGEQGFCPLPLVKRYRRHLMESRFPLSSIRNIGIMAHIDAGQDDDDRTDPVLHRQDAQDGRGP